MNEASDNNCDAFTTSDTAASDFMTASSDGAAGAAVAAGGFGTGVSEISGS